MYFDSKEVYFILCLMELFAVLCKCLTQVSSDDSSDPMSAFLFFSMPVGLILDKFWAEMSKPYRDSVLVIFYEIKLNSEISSYSTSN